MTSKHQFIQAIAVAVIAGLIADVIRQKLKASQNG